MTHSEIRYFPILVVIPRLFFGRGFYDLVPGFYGLFPELVPYGLVPGTCDLFLELVPYGLVPGTCDLFLMEMVPYGSSFQIQAWFLKGDKWVLCCPFTLGERVCILRQGFSYVALAGSLCRPGYLKLSEICLPLPLEC